MLALRNIATDVFLFSGNNDLVAHKSKVSRVVTIAGKIWSTLKILESTSFIYFDRFKYTVKFELGI